MFVKWSQKLGFTLKELDQLLQLHGTLAHAHSARIGRKSAELQAIIHMAQGKMQTIEEKIQRLKAIRGQMAAVVKELQKATGPVCPASQQSRTSARRNSN
jgi:DNA-binding transcriptional MerR regulator